MRTSNILFEQYWIVKTRTISISTSFFLVKGSNGGLLCLIDTHVVHSSFLIQNLCFCHGLFYYYTILRYPTTGEDWVKNWRHIIRTKLLIYEQHKIGSMIIRNRRYTNKTFHFIVEWSSIPQSGNEWRDSSEMMMLTFNAKHNF